MHSEGLPYSERNSSDRRTRTFARIVRSTDEGALPELPGAEKLVCGAAPTYANLTASRSIR